jgi:hypothetical protein
MIVKDSLRGCWEKLVTVTNLGQKNHEYEVRLRHFHSSVRYQCEFPRFDESHCGRDDRSCTIQTIESDSFSTGSFLRVRLWS